jgi:hypothetical protein
MIGKMLGFCERTPLPEDFLTPDFEPPKRWQ